MTTDLPQYRHYNYSNKKFFLLFFSFGIFCVSRCDNNRFHHQGNVKGRPAWTLPQVPRIAIVGAGVGGSGVAYFLDEIVGHSSVQVDLYEKSDIVGGRLHTVEIFGRAYETGGSIIHPRNKYAVDLVEKLGLRKKEKEPASEFGLLKDHQVVFSSSSWKFVTILKILYRYGFDFNHLHSFTNKLIDDFSKIYKLQSQDVPFAAEHPFELLSAMSPTVANLTRSTFKTFLLGLGFKEIFIDELVTAITYVNYGQDANLHSLVGSIAVAGASDGLWSIEDGNKQLPIALAKHSKANLKLNSLIQSITDHRNGSYGLSIRTASTSKNNVTSFEEKMENYDIVVIANPLEVSKIKFVNFETIPYDVEERKYHQTVATIVAGTLQENFTMSKASVDSLFACDAGTFFTSVGRIYPVDSKSKSKSSSSSSHSQQEEEGGEEEYPVYKIFSPKPLLNDQLKIIFSKIYQVHAFNWKAYPHYNVGSETPSFDSLPPFLLDNWNLFYLNSIEWTASAIEMSLISAKNIAILLSQRLEENQNGRNDNNNNNNNSPNRNFVGDKNKPNVESTRKIEL